MSKRNNPQSEPSNSLYKAKLIVHQRDRNRCSDCGAVVDNPDELDLDHIVPRGAGGSHRLSNMSSLCRRCHEAKHDEDTLAPTIRFISTGDMTEREFIHFRHFFNEQIPALTRRVCEPGIDPMFNLGDQDAWHIPIGDLLRLDSKLREDDIPYKSIAVADYM